MKYSKEKQIGDQGEHLVAMTITRMFGWPCRLQDKDTGIDAEYETTDDQGEVTGEIVKIQVKTKEEMFNLGINGFYPEENHVNYWKEFSVPVVFCYVSLKSNEVMWVLIDPEGDYRNRGVGQKITFDYPTNVLSQDDAIELRRIARRNKDPLSQLVRQAQLDMKRVWSGDRLLLDYRSSEDDSFFSELASLLRRISAMSDAQATALNDQVLAGRIEHLWNRYMAADRALNRRADEDCEARDG